MAELQTSTEGMISTQDVAQTPMRVWLLAPGRGGKFWEYWRGNDIITIGWDELGDLREYSGRSVIENQLSEIYDRSSSPKIDGKACWEFRAEMNVGDLVFFKRGTTELLGAGVVASDYRFEAKQREGSRHVRDVHWIIHGDWTTASRSRPRPRWDQPKKERDGWRSEPRVLPRKTLTEITDYEAMRAELEIRLGIDGQAATGRRDRLPIDDELLDTAVEDVIRPAVEEGLFEEGGGEHYIVGECNKKGLNVQQKATRFAEIADKIGAQRLSEPFDLGSCSLLRIGRNWQKLDFFGAAIPTSRG